MTPDNDDDLDDDALHEGFKTAYLVRLRPDEKYPREFVGIFVAEGLDSLRELVDECCPVNSTEYRILPSGSVMAPSRSNTVPWPAAELEKDSFNPLAGARLSELWEPFFDEPGDDAAWTKLEWGVPVGWLDRPIG